MLAMLGDIIQVSNPVMAFVMAEDRQDYLKVYATAIGLSLGVKRLGENIRFSGSRRPNQGDYRGMPSGHTASAWASASYVRSNGLYTLAALTGCSRIVARKHTWQQVLAAILLGEGVVWANGLKSSQVKVTLIKNGFKVVVKL